MSAATLTEFLLARIAERRRHAEALAVAMAADSFTAPASLVNLGALVDPSRVIAECKAQRAIVELAATTAADATMNEQGPILAKAVLAMFAITHDKHPDYRNEWEHPDYRNERKP